MLGRGTRPAHEAREARRRRPADPPRDAEQQQGEDGVARAHVPRHPRSAEPARDVREDDEGGERPVEEARRQVPDGALFARCGHQRRLARYSSWHALQASSAACTAFLSAAMSPLAAAAGSLPVSSIMLLIFLSKSARFAQISGFARVSPALLSVPSPKKFLCSCATRATISASRTASSFA